MTKKMLIDASHPEETRVVLADGNKVEDFDFESINKRQLAGNIYLAKVTRVEPSLQAAFVDYGGNRHGFLAFAEIHPDYYQIPVADREALIAEEEAAQADEARADDPDAEEKPAKRRQRRTRSGKPDEDGAEQSSEAKAEDKRGRGNRGGRGRGRSARQDAPAGGADPAPIAGLEVIDLAPESEGLDQTDGTASAEGSPSGMTVTEAAGSDEAQSASAAAETTQGAPAQASAEAPAETASESAPGVAETAAAAGPAEEAAEAAEEAPETPPSEPAKKPRRSRAKSAAKTAVAGDAETAGSAETPKTAETAEAAPPKKATRSRTRKPTPKTAPAASAEAAPDDAAAGPDAAPEGQTKPKTTRTRRSPRKKASESTPDASVAAGSPDANPNANPDAAPASAPASASASRPESAADDAASDAQGPDEASSERQSKGPKSIAEATGLDDETVTEDLPASEADDSAPQKRSGSRRGGRRGRGESRHDTSPSPDGEDSAGVSEPVHVESIGADDVQDEIAPSHHRFRRRYKIQDVIKVRQILLVQVVKEERGNKGAALTTYLSLAGRYCVLMPNTARGGGISRKITNATDRKRLREVVGTLEVPKGMGLIVRTAGAERTKPEIKRDYEFLLRQWEQIRELTLQSIAPTLIYEEGSLIKRSIRDLYTKEIDGILVEGEDGYREAKDYMKMLMPSHARKVQQYGDQIPLFIRYQVESYLNGLFSPVVQLKSGGYIVIGITEALVAIDINSGRSTKEGSIEETALKTNLEAADEIARQLRLRDLAGLIVIDFIDMDENRNNRAVEKRLKERLKNDRARLQLGRISAFGLLEMSRQRLRSGMLESSTQPCPHCHGTGAIRSDDSLSLAILREVEEEGLRERSSGVTIVCPVDIANYLINQKRTHIAQIEARHGLQINVAADPSLITPDYRIDRLKSVTPRPEQMPTVVTAEAAIQPIDIEDAEIIDDASPAAPPAEAAPRERQRPESEEHGDGDDKPRRRRGKRGGRRRRGRGGNESDGAETRAQSGRDKVSDAATLSDPTTTDHAAGPSAATEAMHAEEAAQGAEEAPEAKPEAGETDAAALDPLGSPDESPEAVAEAAPQEAGDPSPDQVIFRETRSGAGAESEETETAAQDADLQPGTPPEQSETAHGGTSEAREPPSPQPAGKPDEPKRRGWWNFGFRR